MGTLPYGRVRPLSRGRRFVADVAHFSRGVPFVTVERRITIPEVAAARRTADPRPSWFSIFLKAFGLASLETPDLRRSLLTFPYPRLYEHACSVAGVAVERKLDGEPAVFILQVRQPEDTPLTGIASQIQRAKTAPLWEVAAFRRMLKLDMLPAPLRRFVWWLGLRTCGSWRQKFYGTFTISSVVNAGGEVTSAVTPMTSYFTFGEVDADGCVTLRLIFDHRVLDAAPAARGLVAVERALKTTILDELRAMAPRAQVSDASQKRWVGRRLTDVSAKSR
jgi:hypothetical protein